PLEGAGAQDIPEHERFNLRPRWQRILVALAGPVMNVLTALAIPLAGALMFGIPATPAPVVDALSRGGAAEIAGMQVGDRIVSFNGNEHPKWETIRGDALLSPGQQLPLVVERNGQRVALTITPTAHVEDGETAGFLDFVPDYGDVPVVVREVEPSTPAAEAGLQPRDRITGIGGHPVGSAEQVTQFIKDHKGQPITLTVDRNGERKDITATPRKLSDGRERLGFRPDEEVPLQRVGLIAGTAYAVNTNLEILRLTGKALGQVFTGQRSARNTLSGPIGIYNAAATSVERLGWAGVFGMLGFLSLNLGIFNLLPIPVLDGGAIFLLVIEGLLATVGLTISVTVRDRIQQVGFVMVLLLMVFVISNDVVKLFSSGPEKPAATAPAK
ncbi:MAG TPA: RIP metalloprotease RseP, partial [Pyrinomonadaceae bacterium]|nr:RIP metalloprotease RseP [Pyrinomonadaceae bacterium]